MKMSMQFEEDAENLVGLIANKGEGQINAKIKQCLPKKGCSVVLTERNGEMVLIQAPQPTNPNTPAQQAVRKVWTHCDGVYRTLTDQQIKQLDLCATAYARNTGEKSIGSYAYFMKLCMTNTAVRCPLAYPTLLYDDFEDGKYTDRDDTAAPPGITYPDWVVFDGTWSAATKSLEKTTWGIGGIYTPYTYAPYDINIRAQLIRKPAWEEYQYLDIELMNYGGGYVGLVLFWSPEEEGFDLWYKPPGEPIKNNIVYADVTSTMINYRLFVSPDGVLHLYRNGVEAMNFPFARFEGNTELLIISGAESKAKLDNIILNPWEP